MQPSVTQQTGVNVIKVDVMEVDVIEAWSTRAQQQKAANEAIKAYLR